MKIALVSSSYHPHFGGVEEHVRHVARELRTRGHRVEVWTVDRGDGLREEIVDGCRVRYLPTPLPARTVPALVNFGLRSPLALAAWVRATVAFRPSVINVQCFGPNGIYGQAIAAITRTPLIVSSHGETLMDEHAVFQHSALLRSALRRAIRHGIVTACSGMVAEDLRSRYGAAYIQIVPNGVDLSESRTSEPARVARSSARPVLVAAGRMVPQKGFDVLLEAAARSAHEPDVWLVGDGAERHRLETQAKKLGIAERVSFLGRRTSAEVQSFMTAADAVVVPSRVEPFGIVVLEAWASGTPVLATVRGGPATIVTDGHDGLLIDPEDVDTVVAAIDRIVGDNSLGDRLARAGSESVRSYTWGRVVDEYVRIYGRVTEVDRQFCPAVTGQRRCSILRIRHLSGGGMRIDRRRAGDRTKELPAR